MNDIILSIFREKTMVGESGVSHALHSGIDQTEGKFLYDLIKENPHIKNTMEIGCAYGISSLYITEALRGRAGAHHTIIDPFQKTQWDGVGLLNLKKAGIDYYSWIEGKSEMALPQILQTKENSFDFIFIDGWHTFDHTLLDIFYSTRLLKVGGILAVDDVNMPAVKKAVDFTLEYPCYEEFRRISYSHQPEKIPLGHGIKAACKGIAKKIFSVGSKRDREVHTSMIALKKIAADERRWDWHCDIF